jgi:hypothetical protein
MAAVDFLASRGMGGPGSPRDLSRGVVTQGKKVYRGRCVSGDRGAAVLRPDQAMERPCGPHAEKHHQEKMWWTSNVPHKWSGFRKKKRKLQGSERTISRPGNPRRRRHRDGACLSAWRHTPTRALRRTLGVPRSRGRASLTAPNSNRSTIRTAQLHLSWVAPADGNDAALLRPADRHVAGQIAPCAPRQCRRQGQRRQSRRPRTSLRTARPYGRAQTSRGSLRWPPA